MDHFRQPHAFGDQSAIGIQQNEIIRLAGMDQTDADLSGEAQCVALDPARVFNVRNLKIRLNARRAWRELLGPDTALRLQRPGGIFDGSSTACRFWYLTY